MSIAVTLAMATTAVGVMIGGNAQIPVNNMAQLSNNYKQIVIRQENCLPGTSKLECNKPSACKTECNKPSTTTPGCNKPSANKPGTNKPGTNKPGTNKPEVDKPDKNTNDNSYASQVIDLVNAERTKAGLQALVLDEKVATAATVRAKEIKQSFSHTRPDGRSFATALTGKGISYKRAGENIAWGQRTPAEVVKGWMNSEGHRANILSEKFTSIGVGYYEENGTAYWTQLFIS